MLIESASCTATYPTFVVSKSSPLLGGLAVVLSTGMPHASLAWSVLGSAATMNRFIESLTRRMADHVSGCSTSRFAKAGAGPVRNVAMDFSSESHALSVVPMSVAASWLSTPLVA